MKALEHWYSRPRRVLLLFALVCTILMVAAAGVPLGYLPGTLEKSIAVSVELEGVPETEVEREIVVPLENALAGLMGVEEIVALCDRGRGRVVVRFLPDTDLERAYGEVRAAVEAAAPGFPPRAQRPQILKSDPDSRPVFAAAFPTAVSERALGEAALKRLYGAVEGVGEIQIGGAGRYDVLVRFDPGRLAAAGLTPRDLVQAVRLNNVVGGFATPGRAPRVVDERFRTLDDLRGTLVGPRLRLEEVAEVGLCPNTGQSIGRVNGSSRLLVFVQAAGDANTVALCRELRHLTASLPAGEVLLDEGSRIESALRELGYSVLTAIALVLLLTVLVQRRLYAALAMSLGIPFAVLAALAAVRFSSRELDVVSLAGIAVGVGLAVDAGVVLVEEHFRLERRSDRALASVRSPLLLSAATTLVVFVPLGFTPRILRDSFGGLALSVTAAVAASTLYVFLVLPVLLGGGWGVQARARMRAPGSLGESLPGGSPGIYVLRLVRWGYFAAARLRIPVAVALAGAVAAAALMVPGLPRASIGMVTDQALRFSVEYPSGWGKEAVADRTRDFEDSLCAVEGLRFVSARYERERAAFYVIPEEAEDLEALSARILTEGRRLRDGFLYFPRSTAQRMSRDVVLTGPDLGTLHLIAGELAARIQGLPGVEGVVFHFKEPLPARLIEVDLTAAARAGVNPREVHQQLLWSLAAPVADKWTTGLEERDIRIGASSVQARGQGSIPGMSGAAAGGGTGGSVLEDMLAMNLISWGTAVPLRGLVRLSEQPESGRIYRTNRQRSLSFEVVFREEQRRRSGTSRGERDRRPRAPSVPTQLVEVIQEYRFPPEYHAALRLADPRQMELNRSLGAALLLAVLLILCVLLFQFESLAPVGIVMLQVPLSFVLPVFVLRLAALPLSVPAMVGLLLTAGITVNNAILVLDAAWARGPRAAASRGALTVNRLYHALTCRLRAMLLASLTTILGVVPLLFAGRAGRGVLAPLSVTIAAGVAGSLGALILSLAVVGRSGRASQEPSSAPRRSRRRAEASSRRRSR